MGCRQPRPDDAIETPASAKAQIYHCTFSGASSDPDLRNWLETWGLGKRLPPACDLRRAIACSLRIKTYPNAEFRSIFED